MEFLRRYGYDSLVHRFEYPVTEVQTPMAQPLCVVYDAPARQGRDLFAKALVEAHYNRWKNPKFIVGNEMGAVLGMLVAVGLEAEEIFDNWTNGLFDPDNLLFGKRRLPRNLGFLHPKKDGALHKGERLCKAIDHFLRSKYELSKKHRMTLQELYGKTGVTILFNAYSITHSDGILLSHMNRPEMPVSEAIMCSLARYPVIKLRKWKKELFCARSASMPLPLGEIKAAYDVWGRGTHGFVHESRVYTVESLTPKDKDREFEMLMARPAIEKQFYSQEISKALKVYRPGFQVEDW